MSKKMMFFAVVALQVLSLLGMIGFKYSVVKTGRTVVLQSVPIDPRDLMRGDFVRIRFAITSLDLSRLTSDGAPLQDGDVVYITLQNSSPAWMLVWVGATLPVVKDDEAVIKGKVTNRNGNLLQVDYGIDSYYVGEGKGRPLEWEKYWKVKLDRKGHAVIEGPAGG